MWVSIPASTDTAVVPSRRWGGEGGGAEKAERRCVGACSRRKGDIDKRLTHDRQTRGGREREGGEVSWLAWWWWWWGGAPSLLLGGIMSTVRTLDKVHLTGRENRWEKGREQAQHRARPPPSPQGTLGRRTTGGAKSWAHVPVREVCPDACTDATAHV